MSDNFPSCNEFIAKYGCESILRTEDFVQINIFENDRYKLILFTTVLHDHIDIKLFECNELITHIYEEGVERIELLNNLIKIHFNDSRNFFDKKLIEIVVFPRFFINSISMIK